MIVINEENIGLIKFGELNIQKVVQNEKVIWPYGNRTIQSCFAQGHWNDQYPWTDNLTWKD